MPFINVKTNSAVSKETELALKSDLGKAISIIPGKSEAWLMVCIEPESILYFKGDDAPAAMVDVNVFGSPNPEAFDRLTKEICGILSERLEIKPSRVYVKYSATTDWGWNNENF